MGHGCGRAGRGRTATGGVSCCLALNSSHCGKSLGAPCPTLYGGCRPRAAVGFDTRRLGVYNHVW